MDPLTVVLLAGGAGLALARKQGAEEEKSPGAAAPSLRDKLQAFKRTSAVHRTTQSTSVTRYPQIRASTSKVNAGSTSANSQYPEEVIREMEARAKAEFEKLSDDAKAAACGQLKAQYPNSPEIQDIDCENADWAIVYTAVGAAVGTAVCGPVCGALGVIVATYLGAKLEEWAEEAWDKIEEWGEEIGEKAQEWGEAAYENTIGAIPGL